MIIYHSLWGSWWLLGDAMMNVAVQRQHRQVEALELWFIKLHKNVFCFIWCFGDKLSCNDLSRNESIKVYQQNNDWAMYNCDAINCINYLFDQYLVIIKSIFMLGLYTISLSHLFPEKIFMYVYNIVLEHHWMRN